MELNIKLCDKSEIERFVLILNLGLLSAIKEQVISAEEATNYFHVPYTAQKLEEIGVSKSVIDLIYNCCLLEDVEELVPNKIDNSIETEKNKTLAILKTLEKPSKIKYWLEE
jgi:hypothetical protein